MWLKSIFIIILFYFFAVLQNSFFAHFSLFGAVPNLVFIFFFLLIFFQKNNGYRNIFLYSIFAGLFLDIFSYTYLGVSVILLLLIGLIIKKVKSLLQENKDNEFPFIYFLPLFIISLILYDSLLIIFVAKFNLMLALTSFNRGFIAEVIYNLVISCLAFYLYKNLLIKRDFPKK